MAKIAEKRIDLPFDRFRYEYEWKGEDATADVDLYRLADRQRLGIERAPKPGDTFWLGHLELVVVDYHSDMWLWEVGLANGRGFQAMYARRLFYFWENLRSRIILTLYVWGLADVRQGERLTWKCIHRGRK